MNRLIEKSKRKLQHLKQQKYRALFHEIDWNERFIMLLGHRGTGKTTLMLQRMETDREKSIYLSLDDFLFETHRLVEVFDELYHLGYRHFYIDQVHRYAHWSIDLKQIYDDYDTVHLITTGSSILDITKGKADLSRRAVVYYLQGLSFREYLFLAKDVYIAPIKLEDILEHHQELTSEFLDLFSWETDFKNYLTHGYYPFFLENKQSYLGKLERTAHLVIESDIIPFEGLNYKTLHSLKKLLFVISQSAPFMPNMSKLSEHTQLPRNTLLKLLDKLDKAKLIKLLKSGTKGVSYLQKPEKIYLENTNLIHLFSNLKPNIGSLRETFFFNQLAYQFPVTSSKFGDFMIDERYTFEVGGPSKGMKQIKGVPLAYLALDIKSGNGVSIPLWLFGFLY